MEDRLSILMELLPRYRSLNAAYSEVTDKLELSFDNQCLVTDFYNEFQDAANFDKAVFNFVLTADREKQPAIIENFKTEIGRNIEIYAGNKSFLDGIDTFEVCRKRLKPFRFEIKDRLEKTKEVWNELKTVRGNLEGASWRGDKMATERLMKEEQHLETLYREEQKKLDALYQLEKDDDKKSSGYLKNLFGEIDGLSRTFLNIITGYFPHEKEVSGKAETDITSVATTYPVETEKVIVNKLAEIESDMIFRTKMFDKLLALEKKLIMDKYLSEDLHWISTHENGKADIKKLVTFLTALIDNNYFLPNRDPKIKSFFEARYHIAIGQNFEKKRREPLVPEYKMVFYEYPF